MAPVSDDQSNPDDGATSSIAQGRNKRTKKDKGGRLAALERLKKAKQDGGKNKYEIKDDDDIYEEVDEEEYSKIVRKRQEEDWIIDDDGGGYVEDGREIFDEEYQEDTDEIASQSKKGASKKKMNPNIRAPDSKPKSIKSMFAASAGRSKPKLEKDVNLNEDDLLGDIMSELHQKPSPSFMPPPVRLKKKTPRSAMNPFSSKVTPKRPNPIRTVPPPAPSEPLTTQDNKPDTSKSAAVESPPPSPPRPKPSKMKTALDGMDWDNMAEPEIEEFNTQPDMKGEEITQFNTQTSTGGAVDVSGIDFDDDMTETDSKRSQGNRNYVTMDTDKENDSSSFASGGQTVWGSDNKPDIPDIVVDSSALPLTQNAAGEQVLRMYWLDAYEDQYKQPGVVYLFGKVWIEAAKAHASCCVAVRNIERKILILPRQHKANTQTWEESGDSVLFIDVYKEFSENITEKYKIMKFKSKKSVQGYAFEKSEVPAEGEYLEVRYPAEYPALPMDLRGETFSHMFGTNKSSLEIFLLERKLKGPCWVDVQMPQLPSPAVTWCKVEAYVNTPGYVSVVETQPALPPLVVMTLNLRTLPNPKTHHNEVIAVTGLVHHKFYMDKPAPKPAFQQHFCAVGKSNDCVFPYDFKEHVQKQTSMKIEVMGNERALLGFLLAKIHKVDPDIITGHDMFGFNLDVLLHRISHNKIPHWSRLGRLKKANMPKLNAAHGAKSAAAASATSGRLVCDVMVSAKELVRCKSYDLPELATHILKEKPHVVDNDEVRPCYNNSKHLVQLLDWTLQDTSYILRIMYDLMVIPLALQITTICGNVMARTLMGGRAERNEYLLLHAFTEKNFIVPDKTYGKAKETVAVTTPLDDDEEGGHMTQAAGAKKGRKKPEYAGGLVLEPKKGFYDKFILLLDFNSLYPSIIQEYNICFTTTSIKKDGGEDPGLSLELPDSDVEPGILPTEIRKLVQSRRQVKAMMKDSTLSQETYMQYDIRQKALKLTANSMYGCLGFSFSRFYAKHLAACVTMKGREILMKTKDLVENMNLEVIYGDTDSIMVNTNSTDIDAVYKLGNKVKAEVNKLYKLLEIDIDGVFKSMLLLKKKKYAALTISKVGDKLVEGQELKGLDIVRRDWCELAKDAGNFVVSEILSGEARDTIVENIHNKLTEVGEKVKEGQIPLELYYITKQLTKNPEDYPDKRSLAHVQVAMRLNSKGGRKLRGGDTVYYVICQDGTSLTSSQRAYHPDEVLKSETLKVDTQYYLSNQVHPVVARLCDPIEGTDAAHIAECLGLDASGYRQAAAGREQDEDEALLGGAGLSDDDRYRDCDRLRLTCRQCSKEVILDAVFTGAKEYVSCALEKCPGCKHLLATQDTLPGIMNRLTVCVRRHVHTYYQGWLKCEDSTCNARVKKLPLIFHRGSPVCHVCHRGVLHPEYTDSALYTQLCFYQYMFDLDRAANKFTEKSEREYARVAGLAHSMKDHYLVLKKHVDAVIRQSAYSEVNLARLFSGLTSLK